MKSLKDKNPSISVVIPTFISEGTIEKCLESVRNQDYPEGKEKTLVDGYGARLIESYAKMSKAGSTEIIEAKGEFIRFRHGFI